MGTGPGGARTMPPGPPLPSRVMRLLPYPIVRLALAAVAATGLVAAPPPVLSQGPPPLVQAQRDLSFGELLIGVPARVDPFDPVRSAELRIRGQNRTIEVHFTLPSALTRPGGGAIPLGFAPADAALSLSAQPSELVPFDPTLPLTIRLQGPWALVRLGGSAYPGSTPPGAYGAPIVLTISDLGS